MQITRVSKKLIPAAFLLYSTVGLANVSNSQISKVLESKDTIEIKAKERKPLDKADLYALSTIIAIITGLGGAKLGMHINNVRKQKKLNYYDEKFDKLSTAVCEYMNSLIEKAGSKRPYFADVQEYVKNTKEFTDAYPSRKESLDMALYVLADNRLNDSQAEMLCQYFIQKATETSEESKETNLFSFLENVNTYNGKVEELIRRTCSSLDGIKANSKILDEQINSDIDNNNNSQEEEIEEQFAARSIIPENIKFSNIGGQEEAIKIIKRELFFPIKYPNAFKNNSMNHGFILYGPSGTGKTLLALALANESQAHFIKLDANELSRKWVGESEENWRKVFEEACDNQPAIIFIDELDAVASKRGNGDNHSDKVLNQILTLMSNVEKNNNKVYVIGATNRLDIIDNAILRPGRLGRHIEMKPPQTIDDVLKILEIHLSDYQVNINIDKTKIASMMLDLKYTGADIAFVVNNSWENAMERNSIYQKMESDAYNDEDMENVQITNSDIQTAIDNYQKKEKNISKIGFRFS